MSDLRNNPALNDLKTQLKASAPVVTIDFHSVWKDSKNKRNDFVVVVEVRKDHVKYKRTVNSVDSSSCTAASFRKKYTRAAQGEGLTEVGLA